MPDPHRDSTLPSTQGRTPPRHFSLIRSFHLADLLTLANAACGIAAIFLTMQYAGGGSIGLFLAAAAMAPLALVFDVLDGRVARARHTHSALGRELDSLADVISFGVAPAVLGFAAGLQGGWDVAILIYFVCCGVSRLARYNVTAESLSQGADKVAYFEGTPIPTTVVITAVVAWLAWQDRLQAAMPGGVIGIAGWDMHPLVLIYALSGTLMVSKTLRIPKF